MARALDALDAALNANPAGANQQAQGPPPPGQPSPANAAPSPAQAKAALASAAQAAAAAMRAARAPMPPSTATARGAQEKSETGALAQAAGTKSGALPTASSSSVGEWGKLPKKVAQELSQGQREAVAGEYRNQIETYYRVIAEKSKKP